MELKFKFVMETVQNVGADARQCCGVPWEQLQTRSPTFPDPRTVEEGTLSAACSDCLCPGELFAVKVAVICHTGACLMLHTKCALVIGQQCIIYGYLH